MGDANPVGTADDQMVLLPVPRQHYPVVVRALAVAMSANGDLNRGVDLPIDGESGASQENPNWRWTREEVRRLKETVHNPSVQALLDLTSERPGEWVSIREVEQRSGRTFFQTRADLGGFTKVVKRMFVDHAAKWPFEAAWAVDGQQQYSYRVSVDVARWWREA